MTKEDLKNVALIVIPLIILLILGLFVFRAGGIYGYISGVLYIATAINQHTGLNIWLARMMAVPFLVFGYYYGIRAILFQKKHQKRGYLSLMAVWSVMCLSMFMTQGSFSRETGEALRYYFTDDRGQIVLREHEGVDADTGTTLQKVTPEIMKHYRLQQEGILEVTDETIFDPNTGQPLKRYYQAEDGMITLFPIDVRFHPEYGTQLEVITPEAAAQFAAQPKKLFSGIKAGSSEPARLVPNGGTPRPMASAEEIAKLNREYTTRIEEQLDATHEEHEQASKAAFEEAIDDAEKLHE